MLSFISLLLASAPALPSCDNLPCSCISTTDPQPTVQVTAAVFVGRVIAVRGAPGFSGAESPDGLPHFMDSVTFVVEQSWKGSQPDTVRAGIDFTGPDCPTRFAPGERYLVYAGLRNATYFIGVCTRTSKLDSKVAQADVRMLGHPNRKRL